jgi:hypothetical protein
MTSKEKSLSRRSLARPRQGPAGETPKIDPATSTGPAGDLNSTRLRAAVARFMGDIVRRAMPLEPGKGSSPQHLPFVDQIELWIDTIKPVPLVENRPGRVYFWLWNRTGAAIERPCSSNYLPETHPRHIQR